VNRRALGIGALVVVLVLVLWYTFLWSPTNADIKEAQDRQEAAQAQADQLRTEIQRLRAAQQDEPAQRARLELLRGGIPDDPNLAQFILDTNDAAVRAGIEFISVAPTPPSAAAAPAGAAAATTATTAPATGGAASAAPAEVRIALQIQGGYFQVLDFLNRLDQMPRIVVTDNITVTSDTASRLSVTLAARMFTRAIPPGFAGAPVTTTVPGGTTTTTPAGGATTTTVAGATTTTVAGATTTTTAGAQP
jgi:Tfp pilus assembly protein PilO